MSVGGLSTAMSEIAKNPRKGDERRAQEDFFDDDPADFDVPAAQPLAPAKKPGRPKGARNKSTEEWRRYLLSQYKSPLIVALEVYSRAPEELARELRMFMVGEGGEILRDSNGREQLRPGAIEDAFKMQCQARDAALPYLHQRQPLAVEHKRVERGLLVIGDVSALGHTMSSQLPLAESEENQQVIDVMPQKSDGQQSDGQNNASDIND